MKKYFVFLIAVSFLFLGCKAQQSYYKNAKYTENVQAHLNRDMQYCDTIARGAMPQSSVYLPQGSTTSYGHSVIRDNYGNVQRGTYTATTHPNQAQELGRMLESINHNIHAENVYKATREQCLAQLGWYYISEDEYIRSNHPPQPTNKPFLQLTSSPSGATVYYRAFNESTYHELKNIVTPTTLYYPPGIANIAPECYKATLQGAESKEVCFDKENSWRKVHFEFDK